MADGWIFLDPFGAQHGSQIRLNVFLGRLWGPSRSQKGPEGGPGLHFDAFGVSVWTIWVLCWPILRHVGAIVGHCGDLLGLLGGGLGPQGTSLGDGIQKGVGESLFGTSIRAILKHILRHFVVEFRGRVRGMVFD